MSGVISIRAAPALSSAFALVTFSDTNNTMQLASLINQQFAQQGFLSLRILIMRT
jgi:hypothetical protein